MLSLLSTSSPHIKACRRLGGQGAPSSSQEKRGSGAWSLEGGGGMGWGGERWCRCLTAYKAQSRANLESMQFLAVFCKFQTTTDNHYL